MPKEERVGEKGVKFRYGQVESEAAVELQEVMPRRYWIHESGLPLFPFYRWESSGSDWLSTLLTVTRLDNGRLGLQIQAEWRRRPGSCAVALRGSPSTNTWWPNQLTHGSGKAFQRVSEDDQQKGEELIDQNQRAKKNTPIRMSSHSLV